MSAVPAEPVVPVASVVPTESAVPAKSTRHGKYTSIAQRTQALTLHAMGIKHSEIEAKTGVKKEAFKSLLRRAKDRGYIPGGPVKEEHVANAPKSGRPTVVTEPVA
ncbi:hypothetical protein C7999DRAFT_30617 [Corynascus novoguineensis]|uniref:Uncharacterized protein n=1 Tax=Corynascus novoguineensis TaxID=1126955 RepID=A0AAN7HKG5_9PEZI|nr:hypothetical protein C7999DRAFT_30617 [Corynascus novoguineensis]